MKVRDLAEILDLSERRIYQLIRKGDIPSVRLGRTIRIPKAVWDAFIESKGEAALLIANAQCDDEAMGATRTRQAIR